MNINNPRISVVIPSFNSGPYLKDCLTSVINQTLPPFEIFVINDGSTDDSLDVLNQFREKICVINQNNKGVSAARNAGIIASTGSWIAIQDSDDIWELTKLEKQWKALASCTDNTICCYTNFFTFGENLPRITGNRPELHCTDFPVARMLANWSVTSNAALFSGSIRGKIDFPVGIGDGEDEIFFALLRREGSFVY